MLRPTLDFGEGYDQGVSVGPTGLLLIFQSPSFTWELQRRKRLKVRGCPIPESLPFSRVPFDGVWRLLQSSCASLAHTTLNTNT